MYDIRLDPVESFKYLGFFISSDGFKPAQATAALHYENAPIQIYWKFYLHKIENFQIKNSDIFHISAQKIDCGYSLEVRGGSNEYPQSMFLSRYKKIMYTPGNPSFTI